MQLALAHHKAGRVKQAATLYQAVLADNPLEPSALQLMGVILHANGEFTLAERMIRQALRLTDTPPIQANLALVLNSLGRHEEAIEACVNALTRRPSYPEALNTMGAALERLGRLPEAETAFRRAIGARPDFPEAWSNLGLALRAMRRLFEAEAATRHAIALNPALARAHGQMGHLLRETGRPADAEAAYRQQAALLPDDGGAQSDLAAAIGSQGRTSEALALLPRAIELAPTRPDAHANMASALQQLDRLEEAEASCSQALALRPDYPDALMTLGLVKRDLGDLPAAEAVLRRAIALRPEDHTGYNHLAIVLHDTGRLHEAMAVLELGLGLVPDDPEMLHHRALLLLLMGRFDDGWPAYEHRFDTRQGRPDQRGFAQTLWSGEDLAGRTILLHAEQGFGDTIQFARYVPSVAALGATVVLEVQPALERLYRSYPGAQIVLRRGEPHPHFDLQAPLLSLPRAFGTRAATIPAPVAPALTPELRAAWRARSPHGRRRVGVVWAGNPRHVNDRRRSVPFAALAPLWSVPDTHFVSLQLGPAAAALSELPPGAIQDVSALLTDFAETAACVAELDLVISADTAAAHLAATMERPVWLLLPFAADWRWLREGADTGWYPTMRLFRRALDQPWTALIEHVAAELRRWG